jgi:cholesterol transport system auxiliary component
MKRGLILIAASGLALGGCVSFGGKVPESLLTLSADMERPVGSDGTAAKGATLVVLPPATPQMLVTDRVVVRTSDTAIAYLADARWSDVPARLFSDLLSEVIAARTGRSVLDRRQFGLAPGARLTGRLNAFELNTSKHSVVISYDAALTQGDGQPMRTRRFEAESPTASEKPEAVARALNEAANRLAVEVADWVGK